MKKMQFYLVFLITMLKYLLKNVINCNFLNILRKFDTIRKKYQKNNDYVQFLPQKH